MLVCLSATAFAQAPNGTGRYYESANNTKGRELKTALFQIIKNPEVDSYDQLWVDYGYSDRRDDGMIWDMYSGITNYEIGGDKQGASISKETSSYNREHSFPKSWFGDEAPMYSDLMHIVPVDSWINSMRNNHPYGENNGEINHSANYFSKLGKCTVSGYSGTVFEPNDEYKGDFARIYFYMATCYEDLIGSWKTKNNDTDMLSGDSYTAYADWALPMLLRWSEQDPVSQKEIDRNRIVQIVQGNRNPFVDYPGLEQYVWGDKTDVAFVYDDYENAVITDEIPDPLPVESSDPLVGEQTFVKIASTMELEMGCHYLVVNEKNNTALSATNKYSSYSIRKDVPVTITDNTITTETGVADKPYTLYVDGQLGAYTLYDPVANKYLAQTDNSKNNLYDVDDDSELVVDGSDAALWRIRFEKGNVKLINKDNGRYILYNETSPRFSTYQNPSKYILHVQLYKHVVSDGVKPVPVHRSSLMDVYTVYGVKVRTARSLTDALEGLPQGVYIVGGRKFVVR
ncbi:MAG: endonuclease [Prevotella sp.]|nr:endonuclease [Prevotella sp.]